MKGLTLESLKHYPSLIPLHMVLLVSMTCGFLYTVRCGIKSPDVSWNYRKNPEPFNAYSNKYYKLMKISDKIPLTTRAPKY